MGIVAVALLLAILTFLGCHARDACSVETTELRALRTVIELVLTPVVGLVGAVTGFYFGEKAGTTKSGL